MVKKIIMILIRTNLVGFNPSSLRLPHFLYSYEKKRIPDVAFALIPSITQKFIFTENNKDTWFQEYNEKTIMIGLCVFPLTHGESVGFV